MKADKQLLVEIFQAWVSDRLSSYQEPTREGTPKGSPIGFSKTKFYAANLMILHGLGVLSLAEIAEKTQTSHGLIRKWRTEKKFNDLAYNSYREFREYVEDHALDCFDNWTPECEKYYALLDMFPASYFFKSKLFDRLINKLNSIDNNNIEQLITEWLQFFVASKFSFDALEADKPSYIDISITTTFILWLFGFILSLNIDPIQKKLIALLFKQLYSIEIDKFLSNKSFSDSSE